MSNDQLYNVDLSQLNIQEQEQKDKNDNTNINNNNNKDDTLHHKINPSQPVYLLRECIYAVQGMSDGMNILFYQNHPTTDESLESVLYRPPQSSSSSSSSSSSDDSLRPPPQYQQQLPSNDMIMICGTLGVYVRYIQHFVYNNNNHHHHFMNITTTSAILRAFRMAVQKELLSYLQFITNITDATLLISTTATTELQHRQQQPISSIQDLIFRIYPYLLRFKILVMIISSCCVENDSSTTIPTTTITNSTSSTVRGINLLSYLYRHLQQHYYNDDDRKFHAPHLSLLQPTPSHLVPTLLRSSIQPLLIMLYRWMMDGIISSNEFFITIQTPTMTTSYRNDDNNNDRYLWHYKYIIEPNRIPQIGIFRIIDTMNDTNISNRSRQIRNNNTRCHTSDLVELIFIIGKGVNYIHQCLHDSSWSLLLQLQMKGNDDHHDIHTVSTTNNIMEQMGLTYESVIQEQQHHVGTMTTSKLRTTLERSALLVHQHILSSLRTQFHLLQHLTVLKQFMLFGQGDFYASFIDSIYMEYPSKQHRTTGMIGIYRHTLTNLFETSLKNTNAVISFPTHVLERIDIDLQLDKDDDANYMFAPPKTSEKNGKTDTTHNKRTVWDALVLKYMVPDPIVAIVHDDAMKMYRTIFVHLFRINHMEYRLHATWRNSSSIYRSLHKNAQYLGISMNQNPDYQQAIQTLRTISLSRHSMIQFITSLKEYIMSEVIERGWKRLVKEMNNARTLDEIISAHDVYLQNIMRQGLLSFHALSNGMVSTVDQSIHHISSLLQLLEYFCDLHDELFEETFLAIEQAEKKRRNAEQLAQQGSWGFHREREAKEQETCFGLSDTTKSTDFDHLSEQFHLGMTSLIQELDVVLNGYRNNLSIPNGTRTPSKALNVTEDTSDDNSEGREDIDFDALRFLASQLNYNEFYGATHF